MSIPDNSPAGDGASARSDQDLPPVEQLLTLYRTMVTIRKFEETVYDVYSRGIMPGLAHLYTGMEAIAVGVCTALEATDNITSTHRGHGHLLAKGGDPRRMFAELLGKQAGYNRGKGGSMHIADMSLGMLGGKRHRGRRVGDCHRRRPVGEKSAAPARLRCLLWRRRPQRRAFL